MLILGIETSGLLCSVAWYQNNRILLEYNVEKPQIHAAFLADLISSGSKKLEISSQDISLIAISTGPGSYTGLRIGMSYAKGYCYGANIPIIGISNFQILSYRAPELNGYILTLINANRGRYYYAKFNNKFENLSEYGIVSEQDLNKFDLQDTGLVIDYYSQFNSNSKPWSELMWIQKVRFNASVLCEIAEKKYQEAGADDINLIEPLYLQAFAGVL
ncbi:tRNA (adenosine(37)-N6)-threonylcarbamoyltransferase complex dimerization subunit type 1 TsaB [Calditrichota bacterium]